MPKLLVIDDEPAVGYSFKRALGRDGLEVTSAQSGASGIEQFNADPPDAVVLDIRLPDQSGLTVFRTLRELAPRVPVIVITAHGTTDTAIEAMKEGAFEYLLKPVDFARMRAVIERALGASRLHAAPPLPGEPEGDRIVGHSPVIQEMCKLIGRVAPQDVNALIVGESGVGKELVALAIVQHSKRAAKPFLAINCAAIPEALLESELFGHEAGAFTGAAQRRIGKFEQANGGTLFLDEVGDLALTAQAKILRILQEQRFERLGGTQSVRTETRVLAATNADLETLVSAGKFRKDLYYRLRGITIRVPPLRERGSDVAELAHYFLFQFNRQMGLDFRGFAPEVLELFESYSWPGNVRELQGVLKQAMLMMPGHLILPDALPPEIQGKGPRSTTDAHQLPEATNLDTLIAEAIATVPGEVYAHVLQAIEARLFGAVLERTQGNQSQASELLGLHRGTLRHKLRDLGLGVEKTITRDG
jgi:DNA-binding NtrC family response regulator